MTTDEVNNSDTYNAVIEQICQKVKDMARPDTENEAESEAESETETASALRATVPMIGDSVIAHYCRWQFFPAKVVSFNKNTLEYTIDWDDPDPTCRVQPYTLIAVNNTPNENEIGVGTSILFKQGTYQYGDSTGDVWHLGEITYIEDIDGEKLYSGKHSKTAEDGLVVTTWPTFSPT